MLLIEVFAVLLKLDPSIAESIDIENVSMVSVVAKETGEFDTGNDMLRSNLLAMKMMEEKKILLEVHDKNRTALSPCQFQLLFSNNFSTT